MATPQGTPGTPGGTEVAAALAGAVEEVVRWMLAPAVREYVAGGSPLSLPEMALLRRLRREGPLRMSHLADWQGLDRSTVTAQISSLVKRGLVEREPDPSDGRAVLVTITPTARRQLRKNAQRAQSLMAGFVADWEEEDRVRLATLLGRLVERMGAVEVPEPSAARR